MICVICGKEFIPKTPNEKTCCKECSRKRQRQYQREYGHRENEKKREMQKRKIERSDRSKRIHKICREQGISYGQAQAQETLKMLASLLKQEPVPLIPSSDTYHADRCGVCGAEVIPEEQYCSHCGQKIDWNSESEE